LIGLGFGLDALGRILDAGDTLIGFVCLWGGMIALWAGLIRIFRASTKFPEVGRDEWEASVRENQDLAARKTLQRRSDG